LQSHEVPAVPLIHQRISGVFPMAKKNAPVRDLPEKKLPAGKADQIKGGRKISD